MSIRPLGAITRAAALSMMMTGLLGGLLFACDEVYADPVTAPFAPFSSGSTDSGLTANRIPPIKCPREAEENGYCSREGARCEYGTSPDPECNTIFHCTKDDSYRLYWKEQTTPQCGAVCPDPSQIVDGAPCDVGDAGAGPEAELHCVTGAATCACTTGRDGAHAHSRKWVCTTPAVDCPTKRPMFGQTCVGSHTCDYGSCVSKRGARMICEDDVWQMELGSCE